MSTITVKAISGHATAHDKKVVVQMLQNEWSTASTPKKRYETLNIGPGTITILVRSTEPDWFGTKHVQARVQFQVTYKA